jgi:hypothetical protein
MDGEQKPAMMIFVSYSHFDAELVDPIVRLLQAVPGGGVFQDRISIRPGKEWRPILMAALLEARLVLVFWCAHSSASTEVAREYTDAIERGKDVVPVLLDSTPLPSTLDKYQWVDLRSLADGMHKAIGATVGERLARSGGLKDLLVGLSEGLGDLLIHHPVFRHIFIILAILFIINTHLATKNCAFYTKIIISLIWNKSTASGGETPKGSAVSGVHSIPR